MCCLIQPTIVSSPNLRFVNRNNKKKFWLSLLCVNKLFQPTLMVSSYIFFDKLCSGNGKSYLIKMLILISFSQTFQHDNSNLKIYTNIRFWVYIFYLFIIIRNSDLKACAICFYYNVKSYIWMGSYIYF